MTAASPGARAVLVQALTAAIAGATAEGDIHVARVAHEALGRLLGEPGEASVADLALERTRRQPKS